jgi:hypothetical protein
MCARVKKHVEDANAKKKTDASKRATQAKATKTVQKAEATAQHAAEAAEYAACLPCRDDATNCPCHPTPCKYLTWAICGNPDCAEPRPKPKACMKRPCTAWRKANNVVIPRQQRQQPAAAQPPPPAGAPHQQRRRQGDSDSDGEEDDVAAGVDLVGQKFFLYSLLEEAVEGECVVVEPGVHVDEDDGTEYDMLWYQYTDPETEEVANECSQVDEVREWVKVYNATL